MCTVGIRSDVSDPIQSAAVLRQFGISVPIEACIRRKSVFAAIKHKLPNVHVCVRRNDDPQSLRVLRNPRTQLGLGPVRQNRYNLIDSNLHVSS